MHSSTDLPSAASAASSPVRASRTSAGEAVIGGRVTKKAVRAPSFPQARVKSIMRLDKDITAVSADAVYAVTIATELFLEVLAKEAFDYARRDNRRSMNYSDVSMAVNEVQEFEFLTEVVPNTMPYQQALERRKVFEETTAAAKTAAANAAAAAAAAVVSGVSANAASGSASGSVVPDE